MEKGRDTGLVLGTGREEDGPGRAFIELRFYRGERGREKGRGRGEKGRQGERGTQSHK